VVIVRDVATGDAIGLVLICAMHPTVLHEDSTLVSGDFPGLTRAHLQREVLGAECPVVYFMGASGNQSPRHVIAANTLEEAKRLGEDLGTRVVEAMSNAAYDDQFSLSSAATELELPLRSFPTIEEAESKLRVAKIRFETLLTKGAPRTECRTAECDVFGAEETMTLARAARSGRVAKFAESSMPAEIQVLRIGPWRFVGWPGEVFVEFALELRTQFSDAYVITLANGELQGYLVTEEAVAEGGYEASNALFKSPDGGAMLVAATKEIIRRSDDD